MKIKLIIIIALIFPNLTLAQTLSFEKFPFNEATSIKIVSFSDMSYTLPHWKYQSCITMPKLSPESNVLQVDLAKMDKVKLLDLNQILKLYQIASDDKMACPEYQSSGNCEEVKRAYGILFLDDQNEIFAMIDFCFECNYWTRYPGETFEPICPQKLRLMAKFFSDNGFE